MILKDSNDFDGFCNIIDNYKQILEVDASMVKYLNKISMTYYNRQIIKESGFNLMNLLKAFG